MENLKQLQNKMNSLELECLNHTSSDVRYKWGEFSDEHASQGRLLWSEVNDEQTLMSAIAQAEQLLKDKK